MKKLPRTLEELDLYQKQTSPLFELREKIYLGIILLCLLLLLE